MMKAKPRTLLACIITFVALSFYEPFWRIFIRAIMEGRNFSWDYAGIGGNGTSGGYWFIVLITAMGLVLLFTGWRGANRLFRWLVTIWVTLLLSSSLAIVISDPGININGETMNVDLPYILTILPFDFLLFTLTIYWLIKYKKINLKESVPQWNRTNNIFLILAIVLMPFEFLFFNLGEQHGIYDKFGVLLTFLQYLLINLSFYPWKASVH